MYRVQSTEYRVTPSLQFLYAVHCKVASRTYELPSGRTEYKGQCTGAANSKSLYSVLCSLYASGADRSAAEDMGGSWRQKIALRLELYSEAKY